MLPLATACLIGLAASAGEDDISSSESLSELIESQNLRIEALEQELYDTEQHSDKLLFYGFFETGFQRLWSSQTELVAAFAQVREWSFILGDIYMYLDINPSHRWRSIIELRINTSSGRLVADPTGAFVVASTAETRLNAPNLGNSAQQIVSSLIVERAYIEHTINDALGIRVGLWLTPFGIWNVDHGSPALIALTDPYFLRYLAFPTHQLGLSIFGSFYSNNWDLNYHLGMSNGRIAGPGYPGLNVQWPNYDFDNNKMFSARLSLHQSMRRLTFGVSTLWGKTKNIIRRLNIVSPTEIIVEDNTLTELEEWALGTDFSFDAKHLKIRMEVTYSHHKWLTGRPIVSVQRELPDSDALEAYLIFACPVKWQNLNWEPYISLHMVWWTAFLEPHDIFASIGPGLNIHLTSSIKWMTQFTWSHRFEYGKERGLVHAPETIFSSLSSRMVVSF